MNDTHAGIRGDAPFMLDYQELFYRDVFFPYLKKYNIKKVFHLGDLVDRRQFIRYETLARTRQMFFDVMRDNNITMDIIPGNHDIAKKHSSEVTSLNQLLDGYSNVKQIHKPEVLEYDGIKFMFLPWITNESHVDSMKFINENDADILCSHLELVGFDMYAGITADHGMDHTIFSKFKEVWSGHYHHKSQRDNIKYLGKEGKGTQTTDGGVYLG